MTITRDQFLEQRSPSRGTANPQHMEMPVWAWLVEEGLDAYSANRKFDGPDAREAGPGWCFDRFGMSRTELSDGRVVYAGGEHEDGYDPDFYIYNDVIVRHPDGRIDIYGYPEAVFPPTDFHSATLVGDRLVLIGSLGYAGERRFGTTQVAVLDLMDMSIAMQETHGECPGWIHGADARLTEDGAAIVISGGLIQRDSEGGLLESFADYELLITTWTWRRTAEHPHQQWEVRREDHEFFSLFLLHCVAMEEEHPEIRTAAGAAGSGFDARKDLDESGVRWDRALYASLFVPPIEHTRVESDFDDGPGFGRKTRSATARLNIGDAAVRYHDEMNSVVVAVEGELDPALTRTLVDDLCDKLARLHGAPCLATRIS